MGEAFDQVHQIAAVTLIDGTILRQLRCLPYPGSELPRWLLLYERPGPSSGSGPDGAARVIEARLEDGKPYRQQPFVPDPDFKKKWDPHPVEEPRRREAIIALSLRLRSPGRDAGVMRTRYHLKERFDAIVSADSKARHRRDLLGRSWRILETVELYGGHLLAHLVMTPIEGKSAEYLVEVGGENAPATRVFTDLDDGEIQTGRTVFDRAAADNLAAALRTRDEAALPPLLVGIEPDRYAENHVRPAVRAQIWNELIAADAKARAMGAGTLVSLRPATPSPVPSRPRGETRTLSRLADHPGVTMITVAVPLDQADAFRKRAAEAVRLYLATHDAEVLPLDGTGATVRDPEALARARARVLLPLLASGEGNEKRIDQAALAAASAQLSLARPTIYRLLGILRKDPRWEAIVPRKAGKPPGPRPFAAPLESLVSEAVDRHIAAGDAAPSIRSLVASVRSAAAVAGLKPPDKAKIAARLKAARSIRERERIFIGSGMIRTLAESWTNGWTTTLKGIELKLGGRVILVAKDIEKGGYRYAIDGGSTSLSYAKREEAQSGAVGRALAEHIDAVAIGRRPDPAFPNLYSIWELSLSILGELAEDFARTAGQRRVYETWDELGSIHAHQGPGRWYLGVGSVAREGVPGQAWRTVAIAPHSISDRHARVPGDYATKQAALAACARAVFLRFCASAEDNR